MSALVITSYIVAALMAVSRILESTKPFWHFVPSKLAAILPSIVVMIPVALDKLGMVQTGQDLVNALLVAGAAALPGAGAAAVQKTE